MIVLAQQKIGPYLVRVEWWDEDNAIALSLTHVITNQHTYLKAEEARELSDFLLLHMRHLTRYNPTTNHSDNQEQGGMR